MLFLFVLFIEQGGCLFDGLTSGCFLYHVGGALCGRGVWAGSARRCSHVAMPLSSAVGPSSFGPRGDCGRGEAVEGGVAAWRPNNFVWRSCKCGGCPWPGGLLWVGAVRLAPKPLEHSWNRAPAKPLHPALLCSVCSSPPPGILPGRYSLSSLLKFHVPPPGSPQNASGRWNSASQAALLGLRGLQGLRAGLALHASTVCNVKRTGWARAASVRWPLQA